MLQHLQERIGHAFDVAGQKRITPSSSVHPSKRTCLSSVSELNEPSRVLDGGAGIWGDELEHSTLSRNVSLEEQATALKKPHPAHNAMDEEYSSEEDDDDSLFDDEDDSIVDIDPTSYLRGIFEERCWDWKTWQTIGELPNLGKCISDDLDISDVSSESSQGSGSPSPRGTVGRFDLKWRHIMLSKDLPGMKKALDENQCCNISNPHGDTVLHKVCRYSSHEMLEELLSRGADVSICDESGRTPLHDGFWTAGSLNPEVLKMIMDRAPHLMLATDRFGAVPLKYVAPKLWASACDWLDSVKDIYWPDKSMNVEDDDDETSAL